MSLAILAYPCFMGKREGYGEKTLGIY